MVALNVPSSVLTATYDNPALGGPDITGMGIAVGVGVGVGDGIGVGVGVGVGVGEGKIMAIGDGVGVGVGVGTGAIEVPNSPNMKATNHFMLT